MKLRPWTFRCLYAVMIAICALQPATVDAELRACFKGATSPVAMEDWVSWPGGPIVIDVLGNDYDEDGDALTIATFTNGAAGTVSLTSDGEALLYTPGNSPVMTDQFDYYISDGGPSIRGTVHLQSTPPPPAEPPPPAAGVSFTYTCSQGTCYFTATWQGVNDAPRLFDWNWGNGISTPPGYSLSTAQTNIPADGTTRQVTLTVTFVSNQTLSTTLPVKNENQTQVVCSFVTGTGTTTTNLNFAAKPVSPLHDSAGNIISNTSVFQYFWNLGDSPFDVPGLGTDGMFQNLMGHDYLNPGTRTVSFIVKDGAREAGRCTKFINVVNDAPTVTALDAIPGDGLTSSKKNFRFVPTVADEYPQQLSAFEWSFGDGFYQTAPRNTAVSHFYNRPGNYNVTLQATDSLGAAGKLTKSITVADLPPTTVSFIYNCIGRNCSFDASATVDDSPSLTYRWNFGDGSPVVSSTEKTTSHTFAADTSYDVVLTVDDATNQVSRTIRLTPRAAPSSAEGQVYYALPPCRLFDSRSGAPLTGGATTNVAVAGLCGVPAEAKAAAVNVTVLSPGDSGGVYLAAAGAPVPTLGAVNLTPSQAPRSNSFVVPVGTGGAIAVTPWFSSVANATMHVTLDIHGYFADALSGSVLSRGPLRYDNITTEPVRQYDSHSDSALTAGTPKLVRIFNSTGADLVPEAEVVQLTATDPRAAGSFTLYPSDLTPPGTTALYAQANVPFSNETFALLAAGGTNRLGVLYNAVAGSSSHITIDSFGFYARNGNYRFQPVTPCRAFDSRQAGGGAPRLTANQIRSMQIQGNCGVPVGTAYALLLARVIAPDAAGSLRTVSFIGGYAEIPFAAGDTFAHTMIANVSAQAAQFDPAASCCYTDFSLQAYGSGLDLAVDVLGYFVAERNLTPETAPDVINAVLNTPITVNVVSNDTDRNADPLKLSPLGVFDPPLHGKATRASDTSVTYTATATGADKFTYEIVDPRGGFARGTVTVNTHAVADWPVAADDTAVANNGSPVTVDVVANDSDSNREFIRLTQAAIVAGPRLGNAVRASDRTITYTPKSGAVGTDRLTYAIEDASGNVAQGTLVITLNRLPSAVNDTAIVQAGNSVTINVLANDLDLDGDTLKLDTPAIVGLPSTGSAVAAADGRSIVYTAGTGSSATFTYATVDSNGGRATAAVTVSINHPPTAANDAFSINSDGGAADLNLTANDTDVDGDVVKLSANPFRSLPLRGTVVRKSDTSVTFIPTAGVNGSDSFTVEVTDGRDGISTSTVALQLCPTAPVLAASPTARTIKRNEPTTLSVTVTGGGTLTYNWFEGNYPSTTKPVGGNSPLLTVTPPNSTSYWVRVTNGCTTLDTTTAAKVTVLNNPPLAIITFNCKSLVCDFSANSSVDDGTMQSWAWEFSDQPGVITRDTAVVTGRSFAQGCFVANMSLADDEGATGQTRQTIAAGDFNPRTFTSGRAGGANVDTHALSYRPPNQTRDANTTGNLNGILEPGERVVVEPTWTVTAGSTLYTATATAVSSPTATVKASILARDAQYSTTQGYSNCWANGKCYVLEVMPNGTRETPHVDLQLTESTTMPGVSGPVAVHVGSSFSDVPPSVWYYGVVESITHANMPGDGCGSGKFCPTDPLTRGAAARWLLKAKYGAAYEPPACTSQPFADVPCTHPYAAWIAQLKADGITAGSGTGTFMPDNATTRAEMSIFVLRTILGGAYTPPACASQPFSDVPCTHWAAPWIADLKARNLAIAPLPNQFWPDVPLDRIGGAHLLYFDFSLAIDRRICTSTPVYVSQPPLPDPVIVNSSPALSSQWAAANVLDHNINSDYASSGAGTNTFIDFDFGSLARITDLTFTDRRSAGGLNGSGASGTTDNVTAFNLIFSVDSTFGNSDDVSVPVASAACCDTVAVPIQNGLGAVARYVRYDVTSISGGGTNAGAAEISFRGYQPAPDNACIPPAIATQPLSQSIGNGGTATLSVTASGSGPFSYQWYEGASGTTTTPVGTNSSTFTTPALSATKSYWVKVTSACNGNVSVHSATATITVTACTAVSLSGPASTAISSGGTATLSVTASGSGPFSYQWYQGVSGSTTAPVGTNSSSFTTAALTTTTSYWVKVTSGCSNTSTFSATATVTVCPALQITSHPASQTISSGQTATLSVAATGSSLTYQWYEGASGVTTTPIANATSASYGTPPLSATKTYWVKVSSACSGTSVNSNAATVTVSAAPPPIARRQFTAATVLSATSITANWTQTPAAGSLLVAVVSASNSSYPIANWTAPAGWTLAKSYEWSNIKTSIYYIANNAGARGPETFSTGTGVYRDQILQLLEYTGIMLANPLDQTAMNGNGTSSSTIDTGYTPATAQSKELVITALSAYAQLQISSPSGGFTQVVQTTSGSQLTTAVHERLTTAAGSWGHTAVMSRNAQWVGMAVTFRGADTSAMFIGTGELYASADPPWPSPRSPYGPRASR